MALLTVASSIFIDAFRSMSSCITKLARPGFLPLMGSRKVSDLMTFAWKWLGSTNQLADHRKLRRTNYEPLIDDAHSYSVTKL